ncbi:excinuclease ABC subunit UvrA [Motiliproteus sp. MSK22-1]|uniref:excinuclease ABC subunit UvrA n=1 Tax=Motiliproteus sp. MSK22-1 TaxID=1897630 RepID=UPI000977D749|nr:excinuclease ABC subunit UvrA [Motiliproteus sp. MSK22-1]OMH26273.1 excinuclease ABC subunit A [Motiliproteus sp. MSK22-1]
MGEELIVVKGARQNNLKNLDLELPTNELIVVTGVSGSGKSTLAFDTIYAEGQRRYVETFSAYARQFLDRMDKPAVDSIQGIPPAIAIDQSNQVRTSRSTVGTMTELNDYLKLLFARLSVLYCRGCGSEVSSDSAQGIVESLYSDLAEDTRLVVCLPINVPHNFSDDEVLQLLNQQGYIRVHSRTRQRVEVVQDRLKLSAANRGRLTEAIEAALHHGGGHVLVYPLDENREAGPALRFSTHHHCAQCDIDYSERTPGLFSFNSPIGACSNCRGFGRTIGVDFGLVIPDENLSLRDGAIKPFQTPSNEEIQQELLRQARRHNIPLDKPWKQLTDQQQQWVWEGEGSWDDGLWFGVQGFFNWLERKSYKMHIRVLLSKYRSYNQCESCKGARLKEDAFWWRVGTLTDAKNALGTATGFVPQGNTLSDTVFEQIPGLTITDLMRLPLVQCADFFDQLHLPGTLDEAAQLLLTEIRSRLNYLLEVGLGYLTLDRQSRTLSGGEVQRINLTTALGTSLVNTLFVLDEPSVGLHPRDIDRLVKVLHRLRDAGNTLLVVEHDPQVILAADRVLDIGPGPGKQGGEINFFGTPEQLLNKKDSLTAQYLNGTKTVTEKGSYRPNKQWANDDPLEISEHPLSKSKVNTLRVQEASAHYRLATGCIEIVKASQHNLKDVSVNIPLKQLVCLTGVSGSGKSTLMRDVLYAGLCRQKGKGGELPGTHQALLGHELIDDVVLVDQSPIGKTTRSIPATYVGAFDAIRKLFVEQPEAKARGYTAGTFSFNSGKGRCPSCSGNGFEQVEMQFLSDVYLRCSDCDGKRYRDEILEIKLLAGRDHGKRTDDRQTPIVEPAEAELQQAKSIAEVLSLTVMEALEFFISAPEVLRCLQPLADVGLGYVQLGQAVPTLSGGEAQRLKLAGHLAETAARSRKKTKQQKSKGQKLQGHVGQAPTSQPHTSEKGILFLFDEPTTGLHFDDIATLMMAFRRLIAAGHSLLVIEHNLDVIQAADWLIDIGPEGGNGGGQLVAQGRPDEIATQGTSHTAQALSDYARTLGSISEQKPAALASPVPAKQKSSNKVIQIHHAREHNLQNVDIKIPRDQFTVISGVSGSGKSTVAFDIVFAEGQRRYLESLNAYARQFVQPASRPDVDAIHGIPPTVAIEQRTSRGGRKSTVATLTEIYHYLRLLYVKLGTQYCPSCDVAIEPQSIETILTHILKTYRNNRQNSQVTLLAPMVVARKGIYKELAKWADAKGYRQLRVDGEYLATADWPQLDRYKEHDIELPVATFDINSKVTAENENRLRQGLQQALEIGNGVVVVTPVGVNSANKNTVEATFSTKRACPSCGCGFDELDPRLFSYNSKHGWCKSCFGTGQENTDFDAEQSGEEDQWLEADKSDRLEGHAGERTCRQCQGLRLNKTALAVRFKEQSIATLAGLSVDDASQWLTKLKLDDREKLIARDLLAELAGRLSFLQQVGLNYLTLDRAAPTLSGGEAQRIRLASQLGSNLQGVCYILDEPTIGLHTRDNRRLIATLRDLQRQGNTVLVVEHDEDTIREADYLIDMGPRAGVHGGEVVAQGTLAELKDNQSSLTGQFLANPLRHPMAGLRDKQLRQQYPVEKLQIIGADENNLNKLDVSIPLHRLVGISGVSGSGKSTLIRSILYRNLRHKINVKQPKANKTKKQRWQGCDEIKNWQSITRILEVDQTPIGKTTRSCPATYLGIWDHIRKLFAETVDARLRGYTPARFSFNTGEGRCGACGGHGMVKIEMNFLPDVRVACEECKGWRFNEETLSVRYKEKHIGEVLAMNIEEATEFFSAVSSVNHALQLLQDVGLGYLTLGQQSPTLSGGEAQRIKLVTELAKAKPGSRVKQHTLYVLDEPTVGLHIADVEKLLHVLHRLVDSGNSVLVIEHNLDVIAESDWVIDMGPEGGSGGGKVIAQGTPATICKRKRSYTGKYLKELLGV